MKKEQPEMVELKLNTNSQKEKSYPNQSNFQRKVAQIKTEHQTIEIYHGISPHLLHTILQGTQPRND